MENWDTKIANTSLNLLSYYVGPSHIQIEAREAVNHKSIRQSCNDQCIYASTQ